MPRVHFRTRRAVFQHCRDIRVSFFYSVWVLKWVKTDFRGEHDSYLLPGRLWFRFYPLPLKNGMKSSFSCIGVMPFGNWVWTHDLCGYSVCGNLSNYLVWILVGWVIVGVERFINTNWRMTLVHCLWVDLDRPPYLINSIVHHTFASDFRRLLCSECCGVQIQEIVLCGKEHSEFTEVEGQGGNCGARIHTSQQKRCLSQSQST